MDRVAEPKLFVSAPAPALTFKKFQLRLQLIGTVPVDIAFNRKSRFDDISETIPTCLILFTILNYDLIYYFSLTQSQSQSRNRIPPTAPASAKSFDSLRLRLHNTYDGRGKNIFRGNGFQTDT
jgi:hypothetical protein